MKKGLKALLLVMCAIVLVVATVFTTLAFMTSKTATITNTFSVGDVTITMDEAKVDTYGNLLNNSGNVWQEGDTLADRVTANTYKLVPNASYTKDPTIHVKAGSEQAYVFVSVANGIAAIEAEGATQIEEQMTANGWNKHSTVENLWYKTDAVDARNQAVDVTVFTNFKVAGNAAVDSYKDASITLVGYAIQKEGFDSAEDAWDRAGAEAIAQGQA